MSPFKLLALAAVLATSASAHAAMVSVTGNGVQVPDANATGISLDIQVADTRLILASGNNVTLTLFNLEHASLFDLAVTLEHIGSGEGALVVFDQVLATGNFSTSVGFDGNYAFNSGASTTLRQGIDPIKFSLDPLPPGTYLPTLADDVTPSELSSAWNGESVAGLWRLHVTDFVDVDISNDGWSWQLDIEVQDSTTVPEPGMLPMLLAAAGLAGAWRRRKVSRR